MMDDDFVVFELMRFKKQKKARVELESDEEFRCRSPPSHVPYKR